MLQCHNFKRLSHFLTMLCNVVQAWSLIQRCQWPCLWSSQTTVISYPKDSEASRFWLTLRYPLYPDHACTSTLSSCLTHAPHALTQSIKSSSCISCIVITHPCTVQELRMQMMSPAFLHVPAFHSTSSSASSSVWTAYAHHTLMPLQALYMPATRHFWWWLGVRPIDKANIHKLLDSNNSVVLVPGGNTECRVMKHGQETLYLRKRLGFVRLAMNHGAPLVPAFAFGQTDTYSYVSWLPGITSYGSLLPRTTVCFINAFGRYSSALELHLTACTVHQCCDRRECSILSFL